MAVWTASAAASGPDPDVGSTNTVPQVRRYDFGCRTPLLLVRLLDRCRCGRHGGWLVIMNCRHAGATAGFTRMGCPWNTLRRTLRPYIPTHCLYCFSVAYYPASLLPDDTWLPCLAILPHLRFGPTPHPTATRLPPWRTSPRPFPHPAYARATRGTTPCTQTYTALFWRFSQLIPGRFHLAALHAARLYTCNAAFCTPTRQRVTALTLHLLPRGIDERFVPHWLSSMDEVPHALPYRCWTARAAAAVLGRVLVLLDRLYADCDIPATPDTHACGTTTVHNLPGLRTSRWPAPGMTTRLRSRHLRILQRAPPPLLLLPVYAG